MLQNRKSAFTVAALLLLLAFALLFRGDPGIEPLDESLVEVTSVVEGMNFKLLKDGRAFRVDESTGRWHFHATVYDPSGMEAAYRQEGETTFRRDPESGKEYLIPTRFREDFEHLEPGREGLRQLIGEQRGWGTVTLQAPESPTVKDYVELRRKILEDQGDFGDATVMPDRTRSHSGTTSLLCRVVPKSAEMITCKASISTPLVHFRKGDDFWFRGWFFMTGARPSSLLDLECEWLDQHGGIRVFIDEDGGLLGELKAIHKPKYRQPESSKVPFPIDQWVELKVHFHLSDVVEEGRIRIWQNGQLLVDSPGATLPLSGIIYSSLEVGISSHSYGDCDAVLWVDDIEFSHAPFE